MTHRTGFTIVELMITLVMTVFLVISVAFVYRACFKSLNAGQNRANAITTLSQAMEVMITDLRYAQGITTCSANSLIFEAVFPSGDSTVITKYRYYLYDTGAAGSNPTFELIKGLVSEPDGVGEVKVSNLKSSAAAGTNVFSCTDGQVTINMTAVIYGETVKVKGQVRPRSMPQGIVGWWKMDEGSGTTAYDSSGNANNGTLTNTPTYAGGVNSGGTSYYLGRSVVFTSASSRYISIPSNAALTFTGSKSYGAWIKWTNSGAQQDIFTRASGYNLYLSSGGTAYYTLTGLTATAQTSTVVTAATWTHIMIVYDSTVGTNGTVYVYKNGAVTNTVTATAGSSTLASNAAAYIGSSSTPNNYFNGRIDDVRVYNRVLSATEVLQIYNAGWSGT